MTTDRSFHRIRLPRACRRVYFHSRLEIAGHRSNIIIAMTGVALGRASASERASAVESRCRDGGRFRCVCDACPQERERDRITLLLARRHRNSSQFRVSRPSRKRKAWPREIAPADSSRDRSCSPARPASIDRAPCEITWTLVIRFIAPLPKFAPKSLSGYLFDAQLLAVVHKLDFSRFHLFDRVVVD